MDLVLVSKGGRSIVVSVIVTFVVLQYLLLLLLLLLLWLSFFSFFGLLALVSLSLSLVPGLLEPRSTGPWFPWSPGLLKNPLP